MISGTQFQFSSTKHSTADNGTSWCIQPEKQKLDWNKDAAAPARLGEQGFAVFCTGTPSPSQIHLDSAAVTSSERVEPEMRYWILWMHHAGSWLLALSLKQVKRKEKFFFWCVFLSQGWSLSTSCTQADDLTSVDSSVQEEAKAVHACEHRIRLWILPLGFYKSQPSIICLK